MITTGTAGLAQGTGDVCIVGSGPAGLTLALALAARGRRVVVLESGLDAPRPDLQSLSAAHVVDPRVHQDPCITMARRLGGTSNLWGARCQPFDPIDFAPRSWVPGADWPLTHAELDRWTADACRWLQCGEPVFADGKDLPSVGDDRMLMHRLERFSTQPRMQVAHRDRLASDRHIDLRLGCTVVDARLHDDGRVAALVVCNPDGARCEVPVERLVLAMGGLETTRLLLVLQRHTPRLFGGPDGPLGRHYMAHVVGEVADVTLATDAMDRAFDFFIDGRGSYVRHRFIPSDAEQHAHALPNVSFWPVVPPVADARHRSGLLSTVFLALSIGPLGRLLVAEAIRQYHAPAGVPWAPHLRNALLGLPSALIGSARFMHQRFASQPRIPGFFVRNPARTYGWSYHAEHFPDPDSRVWLGDEVDRFGMPRLVVDLRFGARDAQALVRAHEVARAWFASTGLGSLRYRQPLEATADAILACAQHGTHQIGTARMGRDGRSAVVDADLRSFDLRNLYLAGSAVFPSSGQANPTLTIVALAARLADHLAGP